MTELAIPTEGITGMLATQVVEGIAQIDEANKVLLSSESGTGVRDIDKAFKEGKVEDEKLVALWKKAEKANEVAKSALLAARNAYRTEVLNEEAATDSEIDKDSVKEVRKMVLSALSLLQTFATANKLDADIAWANSIAVPQVGRQGSSTVGGTKKPRARVTFGDTTSESFGEAAKAYSAIEGNPTVVSGDLVQAWSDAGEGETFTFNGDTFKVVLKNAA